MSKFQSIRRAFFLATSVAVGALAASCVIAAPLQTPHEKTILYGAAYYNEYYPEAIRETQLGKDIAMMQKAGINVVRMGESSWGKWEPEEGKFDFAWMDHVVDAMSKAGIKVIMGTPTYSIPPWMFKAHPEMLARPMNGGDVDYGMRQNMNIDDPSFRRYAEGVIVALADHYRNNPAVIGWQVDNETSANDSTNPSVFAEFVQTLKAKYKTPEALNDAWLLSYWGQQVYKWEDMPTREKANSTSYKLEWARFQQMRASRYIAWQSALLREHIRSDQWLDTNHAGMLRTDVNGPELDRPLDMVGADIYFDWQDTYDGRTEDLDGAVAWSTKHRNYFVAETNIQTQWWDAKRQLPPYDGQLYQSAFSDISSGANMVSYWHWASIHGGQETYWKGVLSHDLTPNRAYAEVSRIGNDLKRVGPELVDLNKDNQVAILYSIDSRNALNFMPFDPVGGEGYEKVFNQMHLALYRANIGTDIVFAENADFSHYKVLVVPALYIADDALLQKISDFVKGGGHVIMTFKSGFANADSIVRWQVAPGPLKAAAGIHYQEASTLLKPVPLKGDPYGLGEKDQAQTIAEFIVPDTAQVVATYDHPFFGQWAAITRNQFGKGTLLYEGTAVGDDLQQAIILSELKKLGMTGPDQDLPACVRIKHAVSNHGKKLHFLFNYSPAAIDVHYAYGAGKDLLTGTALAMNQSVTLEPWGVIIAEEK